MVSHVLQVKHTYYGRSKSYILSNKFTIYYIITINCLTENVKYLIFSIHKLKSILSAFILSYRHNIKAIYGIDLIQ